MGSIRCESFNKSRIELLQCAEGGVKGDGVVAVNECMCVCGEVLCQNARCSISGSAK